jgi:hypothetical protein
MVDFNSILQFTPLSSKSSLHFRGFNQNVVHTSDITHILNMPCSSHPPWFDDPNNVFVKRLNYETPHYAIF